MSNLHTSSFKNLIKILPFITFLFSLIFISCKDKEEMIVDISNPEIITEDTIETPPVIEPINHCPQGKYNGIVVTYQNTREEVDALGAKVIHSWFQWDFVEENLTAPFLTKEEVTEEMIEKYALGERQGIDWSFTDEHVNEYAGLDLIMGVGSGWKNSMPLFNEEKITPDIIGREEYIGQLYLHTRACVRRYKDKVLLWQIENEPNIPELLMALGLREGDAWNDIDFVTRVLAVLEEAVRLEAPEALVTINFFADAEGYEEDISRWIANLAAGKAVIILETGFGSGPVTSDFTEENQKTFIQEVYSRIDDFNGCGAMYFKHSTSEQNDTDFFAFRHYRGLIRGNDESKLSWHFLRDFFSME